MAVDPLTEKRMKQDAFERKLLGSLALSMWLGSALIMIGIAIWPQYGGWNRIIIALDIICVLILLGVPRIKKYKISYAENPLGQVALSFVAGMVIFALFSAAVAEIQGVPLAIRGDRFILDPWPWGPQGFFIWFYTYHYKTQRGQTA